MYGKYPNGGMTEIDSHNVNFLEDEFSTIGGIKKDTKLYELHQDIQACFGEGKNLHSNQVTKTAHIPY